MGLLEWLGKSESQMILLTFGILIAAIVIGIFQIKVNNNISKLNERSLELESHVEIFAEYDKDLLQKGILVLRIENAGLHPIYLEEYILNGNPPINLDESVLATHSWFSIPIQKGTSNFKLQIIYEDVKGVRYKTDILGEPIGDFFGIKTLKKEIINPP